MLTSCHIQNFRCLRDVKIDLAPVTAFVGPNASGKSAILDALDSGQRLLKIDYFRRERTAPAAVHAQFNGLSADTGKVAKNAQGELEQYRFQLLHIDLAEARSTIQLKKEPALDETGAKITNVFASLTRKVQETIARELCRLVPVLADVDVQPVSEGHHQLVFQDRWMPSLWYSAHHVSDGTILLLAFLILQHQPEPVDVIAIEEPERGLHPYLLTELVAMLRRLSKGEGGRKPIQFLLATHSAELLDRLEPEEVRFVTRDAKTGETRVEAPNPAAEGWKEAYREYQESLGSIWLSGGMGGVP